MIHGPDRIVACPRCGGLAKHGTLRSGNTFNARVWTDGKRIAPMLPRPPAVVKCSHCAEYYWLADAQAVGTLNPRGGEDGPIDPAWKVARRVDELNAAEYHEAIASGLAKDREEEKYLRMLAWWRVNDAHRARSVIRAGGVRVSPEAIRENLLALAGLLDPADEESLVMKAEILRELGEFESAAAILDRIGSSRLAAVVGQLRSLCDRNDAAVRELKFDS